MTLLTHKLCNAVIIMPLALVLYLGLCLNIAWANTVSSYSYQAPAMQAMEEQLKSMLKRKIIDTPAVNPSRSLPPIIVTSLSDSSVYNDELDNKTAKPASFFEKLIIAAKKRTELDIRYDGSYRKISYPMGDVDPNIGVCTDVVIRSYRTLGIDLQQLVHEDIRKNFHLYPSRWRWGLTEPDTNIDHRRVLNLQVFFRRHGESLPASFEVTDYQPGDLVTWQIGPKLPHIGIVVDEYAEDGSGRPLIVHNIGEGPKRDDILFSFPITGHYRYEPGMKKNPSPTKPFNILVRNDAPKAHENVNLLRAAMILLPNL